MRPVFSVVLPAGCGFESHGAWAAPVGDIEDPMQLLQTLPRRAAGEAVKTSGPVAVVGAEAVEAEFGDRDGGHAGEADVEERGPG